MNENCTKIYLNSPLPKKKIKILTMCMTISYKKKKAIIKLRPTIKIYIFLWWE